MKLLHRDGDGADTRLLREAQAMARLSHPHIVSVHEVGTHAGQIYIAMEFVHGVTLAQWLTQKEHGWRDVVEVFRQAGSGLAAAHDVGLVHRDFKPKSRRPSQTAPQPTDRPHSRKSGRFERVAVFRLAPPCPCMPQILAKLWQRAGPPEDRRGRPRRARQPTRMRST